jgi:hypothetical protein
MAEYGSRRPASDRSAQENLFEIQRERGGKIGELLPTLGISQSLRKELEDKGLKGFKRGGKVKKTGTAKLHKGERVLTKAQAKKPAVKKAVARKPAVRRRSR